MRRVGDRVILAQMVGRIDAQEVSRGLMRLVNPPLAAYFVCLKWLVRW